VAPSTSFRHAVVIWKIIETTRLPTLYLKDPARPTTNLDVGLNDLMLGAWVYASFEYTQIKVYARKFMFTEPPAHIWTLYRPLGAG